MTLREQRDRLRKNRELLYQFAEINGIPLQDGEGHRPYFVAVEYVRRKVGILNSKHRQSLAFDLWITSEDGVKILWEDPRYEKLAVFWRSLGMTAGFFFKKKDAYHFE